jgi:hypothetical protein
MKRKFFVLSLLAILFTSSWLVMQAAAQDPSKPEGISPGAQPTDAPDQAIPPRSETPAGEGGGIDSLSGSFVVFDPSAGGDVFYNPGVDQTFCFRAETFTTDWEFVYSLYARFPFDAKVTDVNLVGTPACTGSGTWGTFGWSFLEYPYEVRINHTRYHGSTDHCTAYYCFDVTSGHGPDAQVSWYWDGDGFGSPPHQPCSSDGYTPWGQNACDEQVNPPASIPPAVPAVALSPFYQEADGCACKWQNYTLDVKNLTGAEASFALTYTVAGPGLVQGPPVTEPIADGASQPIDVQVRLDGCMLPGTTITATVHARDPVSGLTDTADIIRNYRGGMLSPSGWSVEPVTDTVPTYWQACTVGTNPAAADEVGYQVGGLSVSMTVQSYLQMYNPASSSWTQLAPQPDPTFGSAAGWIDGNLYVAGGYTSTSWVSTADLQVYTPITGTWDNTTYPDLPTSGGRGGVSGGVAPCHSGTGSCLFVVGGGSTGSFGNTTRDTWEFNPQTHAWTQLDTRPAGSTPDGILFGGGVGCGGYIFQGGDYRGYDDFYRFDPAQPTGAQWTQMADIPFGAGKMSPTMVCGGDQRSVYLIGGDPQGYWYTYNATVFRYDIPTNTWSGPLPSRLHTGVTGSCGLAVDHTLWTFGGTRGSGALDPAPHESLGPAACTSCVAYDVSATAPLTAEIGSVISYTITIDPYRYERGMNLSNPLPPGVEFAGGLTTTVGTAWYEPEPANSVFWTMPAGYKVAAPRPAGKPLLITGSPADAADVAGAEPEANPSLPAAAPVQPFAPQDLLWDNGPLVTHPGGGAGGADASALQITLTMNTYGFGHQADLGYRVADDFTVGGSSSWRIDRITFFAYQTDGPVSPSPITGVYYQIWDGPPDVITSTVVFGDLTTNRLLNTTWSNIYRVSDANLLSPIRPIYADTASAGVILPPGTYWIEWMTDGDTSYSGPWAPPISILGQTTTGNALHETGGGWAPANDSGTITQQGLPFVIEGRVIEPIEITFDATVTAPVFENIRNTGSVTCGSPEMAKDFTADTRVVGTIDIGGSVPLLPVTVEVPIGTSQTRALQVCNAGNAPLAWGFGETPLGSLLASWTVPRTAGQFRAVPRVEVMPQPGVLPQLQSAAEPDGGAPAAPLHAESVLWDQPSANTNGWVDQYFPDFSAGVFSADDFVITHTWVITSIYVQGTSPDMTEGQLTDAEDLNWCFYADLGDKPYGIPRLGGEFACITLPPTDPNHAVTVNLAALPGGPLTLPPGAYWMSFYPSLNFFLYNQWFWDVATTTNGQTAHVIDERDLFDRGLLNWASWTELGAAGTPDAAFRLEGKALLDTPWLSETPINGMVGSGLCTQVGLTLASAGLPVGVYNTGLFLTSNDPDEPYFYAPVTMTVALHNLYLPIMKK